MKINLYDYQQVFYDKIINALKSNRKVCAALATGGGKSVIIGKLASDLRGRTLILTHRAEILQQNEEWLKDAAILNSKENTLKLNTTIVIAMVQTLYARIESYGIDYIGHFDNIILDEIHVDIFEKVFKRYTYARLIGFTGTPVLNKNKYYEMNGLEYVEPMTLSDTFEVLVCGPTTQELIDKGFLVRDYNIVLDLPNFGELKGSATQPDGYTLKSLNDVYSNSVSIKILNDSIDKYCKGKKTIIFNASNKITKFIYENLKKKGLNVKRYDSSGGTEINPETGRKFTRSEIIDWFRMERDAILVNTNVFTIGFNVTDIEVVIVNRATKSLSLWIQMVGRGSRTTKEVYKDHFTVIDLGQNIYEHGIWSKDRNWMDYFYSPGPRLKASVDMLSTWTCNNCGYINLKTELNCTDCGMSYLEANPAEESSRKLKEGNLRALGEMPLPTAASIIRYTESIDEDLNFAFKLAEQKIIELFIYYKVSNSFYHKKIVEFQKRVMDIYRPLYFGLGKSNLRGNRKRKLETMYEKLLTKIIKTMGYD